MLILLSGLVGAIIGTIISIIYHNISGQERRKEQVIMEIVKWTDDVYERLQMMQLQKEKVYNGEEPPLSAEEYRIISREVKVMLLSSRLSLMVAFSFGEGEAVLEMNTLQGELLKVARILWNTKKETWSESKEKIFNSFSQTIDPLRDAISRRFLNSVKLRFILDGSWLKKKIFL